MTAPALQVTRRERALGRVALLALLASTVLSLAVAPPDALQGDIQRLMYLHVPAAWLAYLAFAVVTVCSIQFLRTKDFWWDMVGQASAEIGVLFTALTILMGAIWGKPIWGVWWTWDPRLTTTAVLLLIYLGYLAVHRLGEDPAKRGKWAAVVGLIGFVDVPLVHFSVLWWRSLHQPPSVLRDGRPTMAGSMLSTLLFAVAAFTLVYVYLLVRRVRIAQMERAQLEVSMAQVGIGPLSESWMGT